MSSTSSSFLRRALIVDAAVSGATAVAMLAAPRPLERLLHLPASLFSVAGVVLVPFVAWLAYLVTRDRIAPRAVQMVIALNIAWVIGSVALLFADRIQPNHLGIGFVLLQAVAVAGFAELQYVALRRAAG